MKITEGLESKKYYELEIEKTRLEMVTIIQEKDKLLDVNKQLQEGNNQISNTINKKQSELNILNDTLTTINSEIREKTIFFNDLIKNQEKQIKETLEKISNYSGLENDLQNKQKLEKELSIEIDNKGIIKKQLLEDIGNLTLEKQNLEILLNKNSKKLDKDLEKLKQDKQILLEEKREFVKEKKEISLVYNKLNKFCKDNNLPFLKI